MHHKRMRPRNRRAGCKLCKPWKVNGFRTERAEGERFGDHRRRSAADAEVRRALALGAIAMSLVFSAPAALEAQVPAACPGALEHLLPYAGTYDHPAILGAPAVSASLDRLLGTERAHLEENLAVAGSIDLVACHLVISGNAERRGGEEMGIVAVNLVNGSVSAAILSSPAIQVYAETSAYLGVPIAIRDWVAVVATELRYRFELPAGAELRTPAAP